MHGYNFKYKRLNIPVSEQKNLSGNASALRKSFYCIAGNKSNYSKLQELIETNGNAINYPQLQLIVTIVRKISEGQARILQSYCIG